MKTNHNQAPIWSKRVKSIEYKLVQPLQLTIYSDSQRLKCFRCGMNLFPWSPFFHTFYDCRQLCCCLDRRLLSFFYDSCCNRTGCRFLTVLFDNFQELFCREKVDDRFG